MKQNEDKEPQPINADDIIQPLEEIREVDKELHKDLATRVRARAKMMEQYLKTGEVEGYKHNHEGFHPMHSFVIGGGFIGFGFLSQISFFFTLYGIGLLIALGFPLMRGRPNKGTISEVKTHLRHDIVQHPSYYILSGLLNWLAFTQVGGYTMPMGEWSITDFFVTIVQAQLGA